MADSTTTYEAAAKQWVKKVAATDLALSATAATYGTPVVITPPAGTSFNVPLAFQATAANVGTETVTVSFNVNFSDGTSVEVAAPTTTSSAALTALAVTTLATQKLLTKNDCKIVSYTIKAKSSIAASTATFTYDFICN